MRTLQETTPAPAESGLERLTLADMRRILGTMRDAPPVPFGITEALMAKAQVARFKDEAAGVPIRPAHLYIIGEIMADERLGSEYLAAFLRALSEAGTEQPG